MELILNTFGAYIYQQDRMFKVKTEEKQALLSPEKIERILVTNAVTFSSDAVLLALESNIDIIFFDKYGDPRGRVWHSRPGSTITVKRRQLELSQDEDGVRLALRWVIQKLNNQKDFLTELANNRKGEKKEFILKKRDFIKSKIPVVENIKGDIEEVRGQIMGNEGVCGRNYFAALSHIMPSQYAFSGRSHRPAGDYFNAFLNYGYGVLYSIVERAILIAGMDPFIGFIHADNYNKKSLVFDLIEPYRIIADKTVTYLFTGKQVKKECCREMTKGFSLDKPGKELLIKSLNSRLDEVVHYKGKNHKVRDTIQLDFHEIAQNLLKKCQMPF